MKQIIVLKIGTSSICDEKTHFPKLSSLSILVETIVELIQLEYRVILVTSGAVGVGLKRLNLDKRPKHLAQVQACAAVGQGRLMSLYDQLFSNFNIPIAQVLLTRENLAERSQYLNACNTLKELLSMNVVPIINENDTVSNAEIRFGDNDSLSAIAASMVSADYLFLLTDVDAMYTDNPKRNPEAKRIKVVKNVAEIRQQVNVNSAGSLLGTGGMMTKLIAAELATTMGITTIITLGSSPQRVLNHLIEFEQYKKEKNAAVLTAGTYFIAKETKMVDKKFWIRNGLSPCGTIFIDAGAVKSITKQKSSLFAAGIVKVEGNFVSQQCVSIKTRINSSDDSIDKSASSHESLDSNDALQAETSKRSHYDCEMAVEVARGLVNYNSSEIAKVAGMKSKNIAQVLGYMETDYIIHRDNLVIMNEQI